MYTSVKIVNGERHNLQLEKDHKNKLKLQESEEHVDNEKFLEKWITRSTKEIIIVESYPQSDLAYKSIDSYAAEAIKVIYENPFENFK
jgi:histidinol dehydrogenase